MSTESESKPKTPRPLKPRRPTIVLSASPTKINKKILFQGSPQALVGCEKLARTKENILHPRLTCPNLECKYFGIVDEHFHALVGYGRHGKSDAIQDLRCQASGRKFSVRWGTALYRLKTSSARVALILALMAEGVDVSALERVFEVKEGTLRTWLNRAGAQADKVHRHFFHHLILHHIQLDELPGTECLWQCGPMCAREARKYGDGRRSMPAANWYQC